MRLTIPVIEHESYELGIHDGTPPPPLRFHKYSKHFWGYFIPAMLQDNALQSQWCSMINML